MQKIQPWLFFLADGQWVLSLGVGAFSEIVSIPINAIDSLLEDTSDIVLQEKSRMEEDNDGLRSSHSTATVCRR